MLQEKAGQQKVARQDWKMEESSQEFQVTKNKVKIHVQKIEESSDAWHMRL